MTMPSGHIIRNSSPGDLRPRTLPQLQKQIQIQILLKYQIQIQPFKYKYKYKLLEDLNEIR